MNKVELKDIYGIVDREIASATGGGRIKRLLTRVYILVGEPTATLVVLFEDGLHKKELEFIDPKAAVDEYNSLP